MNTFTTTLKAAALAAAIAINANAADLSGSVPMDFRANGVAAIAGDYVVAERSPGTVIVKSATGKNIAFARMPVLTSERPSRSVLTFTRKAGVFQLTGYCVTGSGCWASMTPSHRDNGSNEKIEVALMVAR